MEFIGGLLEGIGLLGALFIIYLGPILLVVVFLFWIISRIEDDNAKRKIRWILCGGILLLVLNWILTH